MSPVRFRESGPFLNDATLECPSSVVAYHAALSRLRLGFEFRLGRSVFVLFEIRQNNFWCFQTYNWCAIPKK